MALKVETKYKTKNGDEREYKNPTMKLQGKYMDEGEVLDLQLTSDLKHWPANEKSKFDNYSCFARRLNDDIGETFLLSLSKQAYYALKQSGAEQGTEVRISRTVKTIQRTGAIIPVIKVEVLGIEDDDITGLEDDDVEDTDSEDPATDGLPSLEGSPETLNTTEERLLYALTRNSRYAPYIAAIKQDTSKIIPALLVVGREQNIACNETTLKGREKALVKALNEQ